MPPKCRFTKEVIVQTALDMVRSDGIETITARALGDRLGSSSKPIFSLFKNMEEVQQEVINAARDVYNQYVKDGLLQEIAFKGVGMQYIKFARNESKLFQLLFMTEQAEKNDLFGILPLIDDNYNEILLSIQSQYGIEENPAKCLYRHLWIYTHGIASLIATNVCDFSEEETSDMLTEVFTSLLVKLKEDKNHD
ncbi:MAG: TetR/AcrR family transcriptional regulator [Ruminococcus sp.]|nr:TetR/AcrR family transcriptional regulator [Ruminococcus sp.]